MHLPPFYRDHEVDFHYGPTPGSMGWQPLSRGSGRIRATRPPIHSPSPRTSRNVIPSPAKAPEFNSTRLLPH
ncbi:unnamed protein product [Nesidiocoris tenuis]|uniref:Uncharacterized protein n=1 Tax=Nesidiocoris tenuis TaxID=355587 RepID=A0A6H5H7D0_9HEMI|nr:unnamed protein product [Nesidiocoris tenuis]